MENFSNSIKSVKKYIFLFLVLTLLLVIQNSNLLDQFNNKPILIFPFAVAVSMFANTESSAIFATLCGFFLDCFSNRVFGVSALFLLVVCTTISIFCIKFIRIRFLNYVFMVTISLLLFEFINFFYFWATTHFKNIWSIWITHYFPTIALTILVSPILYAITSKIFKIFNQRKLILDD